MRQTAMQKELNNFFLGIFALAAMLFIGAVFFPNRETPKATNGLPVFVDYKDSLRETYHLEPYGKDSRLMFGYDTFHISRIYFMHPTKGKTYIQTFW